MPSASRSLLVFLSFLLFSSGVSQDSCQPQKHESRLMKSLLCNYDKTMRPVLSEAEALTVDFLLHPTYIHLDEEEQILKVYTWATISWKDAYLHWDPEQNNGMDELLPDSDDIWTPDISLIGQGRSESQPLSRMPCWILSDGHVICAVPVNLRAHCTSDLVRWPLGVQTCAVSIASSYSPDSVNLTLEGNGFNLKYLRQMKAWELLSSEARVTPRSAPSGVAASTLDYTFTVQRRSRAHLFTVGVPAVVVAALTLLSLLLEAECPERVGLGCTVALANCLYLQYLGAMLPSNGDRVPAIVVFFRDSLFLAGSSLALTVFLRGVGGVRAPPPQWLSALLSAALNTRPGRLALLLQLGPKSGLQDRADANKDASVMAKSDGRSGSPAPEDGAWQLAAAFLDRVAVVVFFISFFILLARYIL